MRVSFADEGGPRASAAGGHFADAKTDGALPSDVGGHLEDRPSDSLFDITNVGSTRPATG
jgi:hypothetical protein